MYCSQCKGIFRARFTFSCRNQYSYLCNQVDGIILWTLSKRCFGIYLIFVVSITRVCDQYDAPLGSPLSIIGCFTPTVFLLILVPWKCVLYVVHQVLLGLHKSSSPKLWSGSETLHRPVSSGLQTFQEKATDFPIHKGFPKHESPVQVTWPKFT